jgi:hypothetical protein
MSSYHTMQRAILELIEALDAAPRHSVRGAATVELTPELVSAIQECRVLTKRRLDGSMDVPRGCVAEDAKKKGSV